MTIKELREKYSLSQSALAKSVGVSTSAIGAIESGRMKVSAKIADAVKVTYGEIVELESMIEKKADSVEKKARLIEAKAAKVEKKAAKTKARAKSAKGKLEAKAAMAAEKLEKKAPAKKAPAKKAAAKKAVEVFIQSPMGGEITPEEILAKVGEVDRVYVRVDQNKIYWVKGDETGSIDLW